MVENRNKRNQKLDSAGVVNTEIRIIGDGMEKNQNMKMDICEHERDQKGQRVNGVTMMNKTQQKLETENQK